MSFGADTSRISLDKRQVAVLREAAGTRITCLSGMLWITQDREGSDWMLRPGEEITLDRNGKTVIEALRPSEARLTEPASSAAPWWKRAGCAVIGYFTELGMRRSAWRRAYRL